ncbi:VOC family protein [Deinococcus yavapaiensis]|uniref:Catechol 2,3-dioxygenase-like lactoylglutathione lyase family enzyme n=1 Tax=Deinococcus yavapaiensis KR-236 TaxID=694435 RepID=A0A318S0G6_9DEIO|nr:VOC family protein [Deinococcus yavapaiensis]PYE50396.1 catechol 2,3-dioxygenase-like lactoylglutathione lyase family enzyme [Deinococcus yavapaiensis KR-236]
MTRRSTQSQNVLGIVHTAIAVSDIHHQIDFWQQVLGFKLDGMAEIGGPLPEDETGVPGIRSKVAMLTKHGQTIELYQPTAPADRQTYRPRPVDIGSWHLALRVTDLDEIVRASRDWGWRVRGKVAVVEEGPGPIGARLVYLHNDDGTILELVQLPQS